jgi:hypothetical protein
VRTPRCGRARGAPLLDAAPPRPVRFVDALVEAAVATQLLAGLGAVSRLARPSLGARVRAEQDRLEAAIAATAGSLPRQATLDAVAALEGLAGELHDAGDHLAGFALEGIGQRLLEATLAPRSDGPGRRPGPRR